MSVFDGKSMDGLTGEQQAVKAIKYLLGRIRKDDRLYHLVGLGSEAFDLLTEAHATLSGEDLATVRKTLSQSA